MLIKSTEVIKTPHQDIEEGACTDENTKVFLQYNCDLGADTYHNQKVGVLVAFLGMTMCLSYSYLIYYLRRASELNFKKWDVSSVTTADFTVQVTIREEIWKCWKDAEASGNPPARTFKEYIKKSM
jgi:hypothetical protein